MTFTTHPEAQLALRHHRRALAFARAWRGPLAVQADLIEDAKHRLNLAIAGTERLLGR
jgi:hypothetical protein